jgi:hypothetical protein
VVIEVVWSSFGATLGLYIIENCVTKEEAAKLVRWERVCHTPMNAKNLLSLRDFEPIDRFF